MKRIVVAIVAATMVTLGIVGVALASATTATAQRKLPVAYDGAYGWTGGAVRPPVIYIGEATVLAKTPRWSSWSRSAATAHGSLWVNNCSPTCAAGHYQKYPATISFSKPAIHKGVLYFSRMKLSYTHNGPRAYTYTWGDLPGATLPGWNGGPTR